MSNSYRDEPPEGSALSTELRVLPKENGTSASTLAFTHILDPLTIVRFWSKVTKSCRVRQIHNLLLLSAFVIAVFGGFGAILVWIIWTMHRALVFHT